VGSFCSLFSRIEKKLEKFLFKKVHNKIMIEIFVIGFFSGMGLIFLILLLLMGALLLIGKYPFKLFSLSALAVSRQLSTKLNPYGKTTKYSYGLMTTKKGGTIGSRVKIVREGAKFKVEKKGREDSTYVAARNLYRLASGKSIKEARELGRQLAQSLRNAGIITNINVATSNSLRGIGDTIFSSLRLNRQRYETLLQKKKGLITIKELEELSNYERLLREDSKKAALAYGEKLGKTYANQPNTLRKEIYRALIVMAQHPLGNKEIALSFIAGVKFGLLTAGTTEARGDKIIKEAVDEYSRFQSKLIKAYNERVMGIALAELKKQLGLQTNIVYEPRFLDLKGREIADALKMGGSIYTYEKGKELARNNNSAKTAEEMIPLMLLDPKRANDLLRGVTVENLSGGRQISQAQTFLNAVTQQASQILSGNAQIGGKGIDIWLQEFITTHPQEISSSLIERRKEEGKKKETRILETALSILGYEEGKKVTTPQNLADAFATLAENTSVSKDETVSAILFTSFVAPSLQGIGNRDQAEKVVKETIKELEKTYHIKIKENLTDIIVDTALTLQPPQLYTNLKDSLQQQVQNFSTAKPIQQALEIYAYQEGRSAGTVALAAPGNPPLQLASKFINLATSIGASSSQTSGMFGAYAIGVAHVLRDQQVVSKGIPDEYVITQTIDEIKEVLTQQGFQIKTKPKKIAKISKSYEPPVDLNEAKNSLQVRENAIAGATQARVSATANPILNRLSQQPLGVDVFATATARKTPLLNHYIMLSL
jgi:hypothetical protein